MIANIPPELRALPQWVVAGADKIPLNPITGERADATDPTTWATFDAALFAQERNGMPHLGFVLSKSDPFCVIDLDDPETKTVAGLSVPETDLTRVLTIGARHRAILDSFPTYAELSQSGKGVHIVCRASVASGARRDRIEVYSDSRYIIFTGNVIKNLPITEQQTLVNFLWEEVKQDALEVAELEQIDGDLTDDELWEMASTAHNAEKFLRLWRGEWQGNPEWPSQSEADFALLAMLGFYSIDNEQCRRMFRYSALGKREKAVKNDRYLNYALSKIRAKTPPPVNFETALGRGNVVQNQIQNENDSALAPSSGQPAGGLQAPSASSPSSSPVGYSLQNSDASGSPVPYRKPQYKKDSFYPPGFVGDLARYFLASAPRPVPEIALAAAIALTAGVVGRAYNISATGLNQYVIVIATTGTGKDGAASGIDNLIAAARSQVPTVDEFIGPSAFASGQALIRVLDKSKCFVSVMGEIGFTLQRICSPNANNSDVMLKKVLLDIYSRSGSGKTLRGSVYSDSDKNTKSVNSPNVTIFGESNPETFFNGLDASNIAEGLIPRFTIIEYAGHRPPRNPFANTPPGHDLLNRFCALVSVAMTANQTNQACNVSTDTDAQCLLDAFDERADWEINHNSADVVKQLWNRAHLKALKMAALIAVGLNPYSPTVTGEVAKWAIDLVTREISCLVAKFENGEVGMGDIRLELDVRRTIKLYLAMSPEERIAQGCPLGMAGMALIPLQFLRRRCRLLVAFKTDRRGATLALKTALAAMVETEALCLLSPMQAQKQCGTSSPVYGLGPAW